MESFTVLQFYWYSWPVNDLKVYKFESLTVCESDCYCAAGRWVVGWNRLLVVGGSHPATATAAAAAA